MQSINANPGTGDPSTVTPANNVNLPGRPVPTKAQSEAHYNMIEAMSPELTSGSTFYPTKGSSGKTA